MIVQLFVFALLAAGFGVYAIIRKRKFIGFMFVLMGLMLFAIGLVVIYFYPHSWPW